MMADDFQYATRVFGHAMELAEGDKSVHDKVGFWAGYAHYREGERLQPARTVESARTSLPWFVRSLELFEAHREYGDRDPSIDMNTFIRNARTFIEIQRAIIERGA